MADKKVIVHVGEDYVTGVVDQSFLDDDEANGRNGDSYYAAASATTLVWDGAAWVAWDPNLNDNKGVTTTMFGMTGAATKFGPSIGFTRKLEAEFGASDPLHLFKFASNATLASDATLGSWGKDPTAKDANNDVFADMTTEWTAAKAALSSDVLRVQAIVVSHGKAEQASDIHTAAYEENLKRWLQDLRYLFLEDADDDPIPIILTKCGLTGGNYDIIRDTHDAMATALPYVTVLTMDEDHIADISDRRSGFGNIILGNDIYSAYQTAVTFDDQEEHSLASLRTMVREEFGIKATDTKQTAIIDKKLNEAMLWIAKQRSDWPWLLAEASIDVAAKRTESTIAHDNVGIDASLRVEGTAMPILDVGAQFTLTGFDTAANNSTRTVSTSTATLITVTDTTGLVLEAAAAGKKMNSGPNPVQNSRKLLGMTSSTKLREIFIGGEITGSEAEGYLIVGGSKAIGYRLQGQYLGATIPGNADCTVVNGWFKLPRDCSRIQNAELVGDNQVAERMIHKNNLEFDKLKRSRVHLQGALSNIKTFYTIKPDPLKKTRDLYLATYPFVTEARVLLLSYWKQPKKLVSPSNQPDLPRADGFVLLHAAFWFMSTYFKDDPDRITFYRVQALQSLSSLVENPKFGEEPDIPPHLPESLFVQMPAGYEQPGNLHA